MAEKPVCIITGGSKGIGLATALRFAQSGPHAIVIAGRTEATLADARRAVESAGGHCATVAADVGTPEGCQQLIAAAAALGPVRVLVNNAGVAPLKPIDQTSDADFSAAVAVNIAGVFHTTRAVWPHMKKAGGGTIINVSSRAASDPYPGFSVYGACKAWVNTFTQAVADEGKPHDIRVFAVAPGGVETGMFRAHFSEVPRDAVLEPDDVAALIVALTGDTWRHSAGQTIQVSK